MIKIFALLPLIMSFLWWLYLRHNGWTIKQGIKGFIYIFAFNALIIGFFTVMLFITN
ncbi:hypothetical protein [Flocculibacter collagenilyticus]|uniref:hypothetical protein n=1 Tax=Flocculibacter collagenilyticus TaxID=2744479 RepID=UPI0018F75D9B|nr:hypothetical protein [Flocculibacter collagenilyticus]